MTVVKINAIEVPEGAGPELEKRFAARAGAVERQDGFEGFQLLRPTEGGTSYYVVTWWESEEHFQGWLSSADFGKGHANAGGAAAAGGGHGAGGEGGGHAATGAGGGRPPVAMGSTLLGFEVVERIDGPAR